MISSTEFRRLTSYPWYWSKKDETVAVYLTLFLVTTKVQSFHLISYESPWDLQHNVNCDEIYKKVIFFLNNVYLTMTIQYIRSPSMYSYSMYFTKIDYQLNYLFSTINIFIFGRKLCVFVRLVDEKKENRRNRRLIRRYGIQFQWHFLRNIIWQNGFQFPVNHIIPQNSCFNKTFNGIS